MSPGQDADFDELVTVATVGVSRKPLPPGLSPVEGPGSGDPAAALLDAAARQTVARRAGYEPVREVAASPSPSASLPGGAAPAFSARAARALREACGWQAGRFPADSRLLPELLRAAAGAGYAAYPTLLPALLDAAARKTALREPVAAVLGARGRWLARHRPDWRAVAETLGDPPADDPGMWRTGRTAQRLAYLTRLRAGDPDAARDLLAESWATETGGDRGQFIAVLEHGLSPADEPFLEAALDDRASAVRVAARRMLTRLPGSAFSRRASRRATAALRPERRGQLLGLVPALPGTPDAAALRDGLNVSPPSPAIGTGAWQLTQVIAAAPLADWTSRVGLSPAEIAALPVAEGLGPDVHAGWRIAAVNQADAEWARALLAVPPSRETPGRPPGAWPPDQVLAAQLPRAEQAGRLAGLLADTRLATVNPPGWGGQGSPLLEEIRDWPGPWPPVLAGAVLSALISVGSHPRLPSAARMLLNEAGRGLPAAGERDYAFRLARMAETCPHAWAPDLRAASEIVMLRRTFLKEIGCAPRPA